MPDSASETRNRINGKQVWSVSSAKMPAAGSASTNGTSDSGKAKTPSKSVNKSGKDKNGRGPFTWASLLDSTPGIKVAPVSAFHHVPISSVWNNFVIDGLMVEVRNFDYSPSGTSNRPVSEAYWIASVVKVAGYFLKLRLEGYEHDDSKDFWMHIQSSQLHSVGWCASQGKPLVPPKSIVNKNHDWREFLMSRLTGAKTLPENFHVQLRESMKSDFRIGMKLEVVDKKRISSVRVATIDNIIGGRLCVVYDHFEDPDSVFWCHEQSPLIHPIGWAQVVGHELRCTSEYAMKSLEKVKNQRWDDNDADFSYFPQLAKLPTFEDKETKFTKGMKLEAIDPLNLSTICVATVTKVLRNNYLMIGIDGMMAADGSDWFCYHASSGNLFPAGFAKLHHLELTPPMDYEKEFQWFKYLSERKAVQAPVSLFNRELPHHDFEEGMYLEAVDLMEPRLICVAMITKVVGRLLKIHFNGWGERYDQWCDCDSVELFPLGWCELVGYPLEPPRDDNDPYSNSSSIPGGFVFDNAMKKRGKAPYKGRYKKRKRNQTGTLDKRVSQAIDDDSVPMMIPTCAFEDETEDCTVFNSIAETHDWSPSRDDSNDETTSGAAVAPPEEAEDTSASNSSVIVKPSPIQLEKLMESKSSALSKEHPQNWSISDVVKYLQLNECGGHAQAFIDNQVTGAKLLRLTRDDVVRFTNNKLGPSLKIFALVESLRKKHA